MMSESAGGKMSEIQHKISVAGRLQTALQMIDEKLEVLRAVLSAAEIKVQNQRHSIKSCRSILDHQEKAKLEQIARCKNRLEDARAEIKDQEGKRERWTIWNWGRMSGAYDKEVKLAGDRLRGLQSEIVTLENRISELHNSIASDMKDGGLQSDVFDLHEAESTIKVTMENVDYLESGDPNFRSGNEIKLTEIADRPHELIKFGAKRIAKEYEALMGEINSLLAASGSVNSAELRTTQKIVSVMQCQSETVKLLHNGSEKINDVERVRRSLVSLRKLIKKSDRIETIMLALKEMQKVIVGAKSCPGLRFLREIDSQNVVQLTIGLPGVSSDAQNFLLEEEATATGSVGKKNKEAKSSLLLPAAVSID